ncbi:MAG: tetratricopeptide repeat protein [bacterium]|nr:tetratricopeptide repeat protein [bacterium]
MADNNLYTQALEAYQKKDYKLANRLIDQFIEANPDNPNGHEAKAMILANMSYYVKALAQLKQVLELSPKNHRAAESYGAILQRAINYHVKNGKFDEAVELAQQSIGVIPEYQATSKGQAAASYACGIAYFERWCKTDNPEDYTNYVNFMKKVCDLDPVSPTGEIMTGIGAYNNGDYQNALNHFQVAKTLRSSNPTAIMWSGLAYSALGSYDLAMPELTAAKKTFSSNPNISASIADVYVAQGDYENAKIEYMSARSLKPHNGDLHYALSNLFMMTGTAAEGINLLKEEISQDPNFQSFYHLALMQHQMGDYASALATCQQGLSVASAPWERTQLNTLRALIAFDQNPAQTEVKLSDADLKALEERQDPAYWVYMSYTDPKEPQRELNARKALREVGPHNRWLHAQAFKSLSLNKQEAKQPVWALEALNQAWMRTPQGSQSLDSMKKRFDVLKAEAIDYLGKEVLKAGKNKDANGAARLAQLQAQLQAVQNASLGNPGSRFLPTMRAPESCPMIVPAETDPSLANLCNAYSEPIRWMVFKDTTN